MKHLCQHADGKCTQCGYPLDPRMLRPCRPGQKLRAMLVPQRPVASQFGLGDYTEKLLAKIGVTPESYVAAKEFAGLAPTCNCAGRKEWLNRVSDWWRGESGS